MNLRKSFIEYSIFSNTAGKGKELFINLLKRVAKILNIPYHDPCCEDEDTGMPLPSGYDTTDGVEKYFDPNSNEWVPIPESSAEFELFTINSPSVILAGAGTVDNPLMAVAPSTSQQEDGLVYGGIVTWVEDYTYEITEAGYYINGIFYISPARLVATGNPVILNPADPTFDRIDVFYVDDTPGTGVLEGTPSSTPDKPIVDPDSQIELSFALVSAATTEPASPSQQQIYLENTGEPNEWVAASSTSRIVVNSATSPVQGTLSVEGTLTLAGDYVTFTNDTPSTIAASFSVLTLKVVPKVSGGNINQKRLQLRWYLGGSPVGASVNVSHGQYGMDFGANTIQTLSIPLADFGILPGDNIDGLRITRSGNQSFGFWLDDIELQGVPVVVPGGGSGVDNFLDLTDTPNTYTGQAGKVPIVNVGETALEFANFPSAGWGLTGNAGTNPATNFLGTTDNQNLVFKRNNTSVLEFRPDNVIVAGAGTHTSPTSGGSIFLGFNAGFNATGAYSSHFIGGVTGSGATNAYYSNFIGTGAGTNATSANNSNFLGYNAGNAATNAYNSNFIGYHTGFNATNASNSNFFGYNTGRSFSGNNVGSNNIIIGTNISLPNATANSINLGGILFGTGTYATTTGDPSITAQAGGRIGMGVVNPDSTLHVVGTMKFVDGNQGLNKVLTSDANGVASWQTPAGGDTTTASNGLTETGNNIELGGSLTKTTAISTSTFGLDITGAPTLVDLLTLNNSGNNRALFIQNNGASAGIYLLSPNATGIFSNSANTIGVDARSDNYIGLQARSASTAFGAASFSTATSTNDSTVTRMLQLLRTTSGTEGDGLGQSIDFEATAGSDNLCNQIISKWTEVASPTRKSELSFTGVHNAVTNILLQISGAGIFTLTQGLQDFADDTAASGGGIPINGLYRTGSVVKIRVS